MQGSSHNLVKVCLPEDQKIMPLVIMKEEKCTHKLWEYFKDGDGVLQPTSVIWETVKKKRGIASLRKELSETRKRIFGDKYENDILAANKKEKPKKSSKAVSKPKSEGKTLPLYLPGIMKPIDVPIENLSEDVMKKLTTKGEKKVSAKISGSK